MHRILNFVHEVLCEEESATSWELIDYRQLFIPGLSFVVVYYVKL